MGNIETTAKTEFPQYLKELCKNFRPTLNKSSFEQNLIPVWTDFGAKFWGCIWPMTKPWRWFWTNVKNILNKSLNQVGTQFWYELFESGGRFFVWCTGGGWKQACCAAGCSGDDGDALGGDHYHNCNASGDMSDQDDQDALKKWPILFYKTPAGTFGESQNARWHRTPSCSRSIKQLFSNFKR